MSMWRQLKSHKVLHLQHVLAICRCVCVTDTQIDRQTDTQATERSLYSISHETYLWQHQQIESHFRKSFPRLENWHSLTIKLVDTPEQTGTSLQLFLHTTDSVEQHWWHYGSQWTSSYGMSRVPSWNLESQ